MVRHDFNPENQCFMQFFPGLPSCACVAWSVGCRELHNSLSRIAGLRIPVPHTIQPESLKQLIVNMTQLSARERPMLSEVYLTLQDIHAELSASGSVPRHLKPVSGVPSAVSAQVQLGRYHQAAPSFMAPSFKVLKKVTSYLDRVFGAKTPRPMDMPVCSSQVSTPFLEATNNSPQHSAPGTFVFSPCISAESFPVHAQLFYEQCTAQSASPVQWRCGRFATCSISFCWVLSSGYPKPIATTTSPVAYTCCAPRVLTWCHGLAELGN